MKLLIADSHQWFLDSSDCFLEFYESDKLLIGQSEHTVERSLVNREYKILVLFLHEDQDFDFDQIKRIKTTHPKLQILVVCTTLDNGYIFDLARSGVKGLVSLKDCGKVDFLKAVNKLAANESYYCKSIYKVLMSQFLIRGDEQKSTTKSDKQITNREEEVLQLISSGFTNQEVGIRLKISPLTVKNHRKNLLDKLACKNTAEMVKVAFQNGIIE